MSITFADVKESQVQEDRIQEINSKCNQILFENKTKQSLVADVCFQRDFGHTDPEYFEFTEVKDPPATEEQSEDTKSRCSQYMFENNKAEPCC